MVRIAISGLAGSGKTSLGEALAKELSNELKKEVKIIKPSLKDLAKEMGIGLLELQKKAEKDPSIDKAFDKKWIKEATAYENVVVANWLAIWLFDADLKVFLNAPLEERVKRIASRDKKSFEMALKETKERDLENRMRYKNLYNIDIFDYSIAHICLNSLYFTIKQEIEIIKKALKEKKLI